MGGLSSLAFRSLAARRGRTLLSVVGIALGVGVLFASLATDAGIESAINRTVADIVGRADLRVAAFSDEGLAPESVAAIDEAPGVVVADPSGGPTATDIATPGSLEPVTARHRPTAGARIRDLPLRRRRPIAGQARGAGHETARRGGQAQAQ